MAVHLAILQYSGIVNTGGCAGNLIDHLLEEPRDIDHGVLSSVPLHDLLV